MSQNQQFLLDRAAMLVDKALKAGADAADAVVARSQSTSVSVRLGKVEGTDASESDDFSLRVFVGKRVASVSANAAGDPAQLAERAVGMARVAPEDPYAGLADEARLATQFPDLDLADTAAPDSARLTSDALAMEEAALAVPGVANSVGAGASSGSGGMVLVTSHGFAGAYNATRYSRSVSVLAGEGTKMERDYDFSSRLFFDELEKPQTIGKSAGERAVRRLNPRKMSTQTVACVFDPRASRGLVGHLAGAINGASVARKTSFLRDFLGKPVMAPGIRVTDNPLIRRGPSSRPFDGEGVSGEALTLVEDGVLQTWLLSTSAAKQLGMTTNGRGVRSGAQVSPASTNLELAPGDATPQEMIRSIWTGFYVTEVFGQGVNMVTGEYSRGASGFWIENGEIAFPVSEVTIASNLKDMFLRMVGANDIDRNFGIAAPTILIEGMTLAGA